MTQNKGTFQTHSEVEATIRAFLAGVGLGLMGISVLSFNTTMPEITVTLQQKFRIIGMRCFSETGEGTDLTLIDANGGIIKSGLVSKLDEGYDLECAEDLLRHESCSRVPDQRYEIIKVYRENENSITGR